ncbi:unnamed protein product [Spirodela intermedia]|uniref:Uncharacterized protein n=1 Tax=Spirodela intermedia TaxID=51605 RepID=A0A7I8LJ61_SPIIN|nr:unnamed protein product [Spirodela intermedia]
MARNQKRPTTMQGPLDREWQNLLPNPSRRINRWHGRR